MSAPLCEPVRVRAPLNSAPRRGRASMERTTCYMRGEIAPGERSAKELAKLVEEIGAVVRAGGGFGMILHAEQRQPLVAHPLQRAVVEVDVRRFEFRRQ